ncbi:hypothetical protein Tco_0646597, partial [Tanacetum coccineum]
MEPIFDPDTRLNDHVHNSNSLRLNSPLSTYCIDYYVRLTMMVANFALIVAEKLYPVTLTYVQFFFIEDILETLVV